MKLPESPVSYWIDRTPGRTFPTFEGGDPLVDVAIVGGGITGITAAVLLKRAGKTVALIEADKIGQGVTGYTTAHLTEAIDTRYRTLISDFGLEGAKLAARASHAALERIDAFVNENHISCGFERLPGFLYSENEKDLGELHEEYEAAKKVGLDVKMTREVPLPFTTVAGVRFANQAQLNIREYLFPLAAEIPGGGSSVYENTRVESLRDDDPCRLETNNGTIRANKVIVAANVPFNRVFLQTKIAHYRSYVLALQSAPALHGLFWDSDDPYHYLRSANVDGAPVLIVGGEDHKTGTEEDTVACYERLLAYAKERIKFSEVSHRWSGQVIEPVDGLPYIGHNSASKRVFVATGYSGNGITFGTVAGMMLSDAVLGRPNPWAELFDATRITPLASAKDYIKENVDVPVHLIGDRLKPADAESIEAVKAGEGKLVDVRGKRVAVFRADDGDLKVLSSVCPHLGCTVHFNNAERTWDCPCHGSRFATDGHVIDGPAMKGLATLSADGEEKKDI
jgi:glycine/D-amino acid oxidase-like deaminating enzyme/nitrite reductase/ring-hydroxylating ferredoxin subunit